MSDCGRGPAGEGGGTVADEFPPEPGPLPSSFLPGEQSAVRPLGITFRPGTQLAGYELGEQIGRGGMAVVYRARDVRLDRWVALKILAPEIARDESFRQRFIRESRAAAAVDHPNIIPVFEAGDADGVLFIAMRYVENGDVGTLAARSGLLDVARVNSIVGQIAAALDAAHAASLIHRDVKPANMLLGSLATHGRPDHVYLSDFGLSKQSVSAPGLTLTGQFMGTLDYMAPEQIEGKTVDGRTDLYALACAAFELLTGAPPFRRDHDLALLWAQVSEPPPRPSPRRAGLPAAVDDVMLRALAKAPDQRQSSCLEFAAQLQEACGLTWGANGQLGSSRPPAGPAHPVTEVASPSNPSGPPLPPPPAAAGLPFPGPPTSGPGAGTSGWRAGPSAPTSAPGPAAGWGQGPPPQAGWDTPPQDPSAWPAQPPAGDAGWLPGMGQGGPGQSGGIPGTPGTRQGGGYQQAPRRRGALIAGLVVLFVAAAAVTAILLTRGHKATPVAHDGRNGPATPTASASPSPTPTPTTSPSSPPPPAVLGPAATVRAYITAINNHNYLRAWNLGGRFTSSSFSAYKAGFAGTQHDTLTILSVRGSVVSAHLAALQTDGTVKDFEGTYTVHNGIITSSSIHPA
jgi:serine/threonine protein kinase